MSLVVQKKLIFKPASQSQCQSDNSQLDDQLDLDNQTEEVEVNTSEDSKKFLVSVNAE